MNRIDNRVWVIGAVLLSGLILVAGWFLGISPVLATAAKADTERAAVMDQNAVNEIRLASLKERSAGLEQLKSEIVEQRKLLPASADLAELLGQLGRLQQISGVTLTDFSVSDGVVFEAAESDAEEPATEDAAKEPATEGAPEEPVEPMAEEVSEAEPAIAGFDLVTKDNFIAIPVSFSAIGTFEQVMAFVADVQAGDRLFLVTGLAVGVEPEGATYKADASGYVYVLLDSAARSSVTTSGSATAAAGE